MGESGCRLKLRLHRLKSVVSRGTNGRGSREQVETEPPPTEVGGMPGGIAGPMRQKGDCRGGRLKLNLHRLKSVVSAPAHCGKKGTVGVVGGN